MRTNSFTAGAAIAITLFSSSICHAEGAAILSASPVTEPQSVVSSLPAPLAGLGRSLLAMFASPEPEAAVEGTSAVATVAPAKDYTIRTGSVSSLAMSAAVGAREEPPVCLDIPAPPATLQTKSKYKSDDSSKSTIDDDALASRDKTVQPIRNSVRLLTKIAYAQSESMAVTQARAQCVLQNVDRWAKAASLIDMRSVDAYLSRDRWVAEIALAVQSASKEVALSSERKALYATWFGAIARDTVDAYSLRLGPKSKTNNHRYWAGLSVAAIGFLLDQDDLKTWAKTSFEIGACQVDSQGFLPAELVRGERALDYHVYALRPLAAIVKLAADNGEPLQSKCLDGFKRLTAMTRNALQDPTEFERIAGLRQSTTFEESSYSAALKLDALPLL